MRVVSSTTCPVGAVIIHANSLRAAANDGVSENCRAAAGFLAIDDVVLHSQIRPVVLLISRLSRQIGIMHVERRIVTVDERHQRLDGTGNPAQWRAVINSPLQATVDVDDTAGRNMRIAARKIQNVLLIGSATSGGAISANLILDCSGVVAGEACRTNAITA